MALTLKRCTEKIRINTAIQIHKCLYTKTKSEHKILWHLKLCECGVTVRNLNMSVKYFIQQDKSLIELIV